MPSNLLLVPAVSPVPRGIIHQNEGFFHPMWPSLWWVRSVFSHIDSQPGADLEKYLWGGERGAGIVEGWQHVPDVYILNLITVWWEIVFKGTGAIYKLIQTVSGQFYNAYTKETTTIPLHVHVIACCIHDRRTLEIRARKCQIGHNFPFNSLLPTGVALGVAVLCLPTPPR